MSAVNDGANQLQIDVPAAVGHVMSVAHLVPELGLFAANFTNSGHFKTGSLSAVAGAIN